MTEKQVIPGFLEQIIQIARRSGPRPTGAQLTAGPLTVDVFGVSFLITIAIAFPDVDGTTFRSAAGNLTVTVLEHVIEIAKSALARHEKLIGRYVVLPIPQIIFEKENPFSTGSQSAPNRED